MEQPTFKLMRSRASYNKGGYIVSIYAEQLQSKSCCGTGSASLLQASHCPRWRSCLELYLFPFHLSIAPSPNRYTAARWRLGQTTITLSVHLESSVAEGRKMACISKRPATLFCRMTGAEAETNGNNKDRSGQNERPRLLVQAYGAWRVRSRPVENKDRQFKAFMQK